MGNTDPVPPGATVLISKGDSPFDWAADRPLRWTTM